ETSGSVRLVRARPLHGASEQGQPGRVQLAGVRHQGGNNCNRNKLAGSKVWRSSAAASNNRATKSSRSTESGRSGPTPRTSSENAWLALLCFLACLSCEEYARCLFGINRILAKWARFTSGDLLLCRQRQVDHSGNCVCAYSTCRACR